MAQRENILGIDAKKALLTIVVAVILVVGVFGLIGKFADWDEILRRSRGRIASGSQSASPGSSARTPATSSATARSRACTAGQGFRSGLSLAIVGIGFGANVLGSAAGGLAVDFWALRRAGASTHDSARRVLGFNTLEWGLLGAFAAVASMFVLAGRGLRRSSGDDARVAHRRPGLRRPRRVCQLTETRGEAQSS